MDRISRREQRDIESRDATEDVDSPSYTATILSSVIDVQSFHRIPNTRLAILTVELADDDERVSSSSLSSESLSISTAYRPSSLETLQPPSTPTTSRFHRITSPGSADSRRRGSLSPFTVRQSSAQPTTTSRSATRLTPRTESASAPVRPSLRAPSEASGSSFVGPRLDPEPRTPGSSRIVSSTRATTRLTPRTSLGVNVYSRSPLSPRGYGSDAPPLADSPPSPTRLTPQSASRGLRALGNVSATPASAISSNSSEYQASNHETPSRTRRNALSPSRSRTTSAPHAPPIASRRESVSATAAQSSGTRESNQISPYVQETLEVVAPSPQRYRTRSSGSFLASPSSNTPSFYSPHSPRSLTLRDISPATCRRTPGPSRSSAPSRETKTSTTPIAILPVEILSEIFVNYVHMTSDQPRNWVPRTRVESCIRASDVETEDPMLLSHVCSHWRSVSINLPALWASVYISEPGRRESNLAGLWFERAKNHPMHIDLTYFGSTRFSISSSASEHPRQSEYYLQRVIRLVLAKSATWKSIRLVIPGMFLDMVHRTLLDAPPCADLEYANFGTSDKVFADNVFLKHGIWGFLTSSGALKRISVPFKFPRGLEEYLTLDRVRDVRIHSIRMPSLLQLLPKLSPSNVKRLVIAELLGPKSKDEVVVPPAQPIVLPTLELFEAHTTVPAADVYDIVTLPVLRELAMSNIFSTSINHGQNRIALRNMLSRSDCRMLANARFLYPRTPLSKDDFLALVTMPELQSASSVQIEPRVVPTPLVIERMLARGADRKYLVLPRALRALLCDDVLSVPLEVKYRFKLCDFEGHRCLL